MVLVTGIYSAAAALAVVPLFGVPLNAILITMVPLVYVTGISGAIHLSNYYLEAARHGEVSEAPGKAIAHAALPLALAAITTAVGLLSLCYSELRPIRLFGVFSAIGVVIGSLTQFTLLPAAFAVWTPLPPQYRRSAGAVDASGSSQLTLFPRLGDWVTSHANLVAIGCLIVMLVTAAGLPKIRTSIQMMRLFSQRAPVIPMTRWLEERLAQRFRWKCSCDSRRRATRRCCRGCDCWQPWTRSCGDCRKRVAVCLRPRLHRVRSRGRFRSARSRKRSSTRSSRNSSTCCTSTAGSPVTATMRSGGSVFASAELMTSIIRRSRRRCESRSIRFSRNNWAKVIRGWK